MARKKKYVHPDITPPQKIREETVYDKELGIDVREIEYEDGSLSRLNAETKKIVAGNKINPHSWPRKLSWEELLSRNMSPGDFDYALKILQGMLEDPKIEPRLKRDIINDMFNRTFGLPVARTKSDVNVTSYADKRAKINELFGIKDKDDNLPALPNQDTE